VQFHAKDLLANTIVPASAEIFNFGKLRHPLKLWKCILESPPGNDPAEIRRCNGKRMVSANDDDIQIDVCISWSAICKLACLSVIQCQAGRPLPQRCGRNRRGGNPPPRSACAIATIVIEKFENAWSESVRDRLQAGAPGALIVCDLGVHARAVLDALPTCFIDHHYFSGAPLNGVVITGFQAEPCPTSGLIAFWCANAIADVSDLEWIAAISLLSDVGERAPFAELTSAKNAHGLSALREATTLLNAARRPSSGNAEPALRLPLRASSPRGISRGHSPDAMVLRQAQQEVNRAYTEAKRARRNSAGAWRLSASTRRVRSTRLSRKSGELGYPITLSSARTPVTAMGLCISADAAARKLS
jgi:hypothetical protein